VSAFFHVFEGGGSLKRSRLTSLCALVFAAVSQMAPSALAQEVPAEQPPAAPAPAEEIAPAGADPAAPVAPEAAPPEAEAPAEAEPVEAEPAPPSVGVEADAVVDDSGSGLFEASLSGGGDAAAAEGAPDAAGATTGGYDLNGYARSDFFVGKVSGADQAEIKAAYAELALQLTLRSQDVGDAFADARLRYGQQGDQHDLFVDLREAYVNAYLGPFDLRLGKQIIVWGRADAFNPTSNLTPIDFRIRSPIEDDRRVGNVGARTILNLLPVRIEGVWLPLYEPTVYPPIEIEELVALQQDFPSTELSEGLLAGRVHLELPSFEASVSYLYGHALLPGLRLADFTVGPDAEIRIAQTAYKHHVAGVDFSTAVGDLFAIRGEAAYRRPVDYETRAYVPRPDLQYVLGVDRAFGPVSVIAQYLGRYTFDWERAEEPDTSLGPDFLLGAMPPLAPLVEQGIVDTVNGILAVRNQALFQQLAEVQHLASVRLEWLTLHDTLSLSALGLMNFTTREWLVFPKVGYRISDRLITYLGGEIYSGPDGTLFDLIDETLTAGYAELRLTF